MSKIGQVNLGLQEQAEELGFESVQSALDCGFKAVLCKDGEMKLVQDADAALAEMMSAHQEYEAERQRVINDLEMLINDTPYMVYRKVLTNAVEFIKRKEV